MRSRFFTALALVVASLLAPTVEGKALTVSGVAGFASAPTLVTATAVAGGANLSWGTPLDAGSGVTGYLVEKSTDGFNWTQIASLSSGQLSYSALGLTAIEHYFRVAATTSAGTGVYGYPWTKIYSTSAPQRNASKSVVYDSGFGIGAGNASSTFSSANFSRVRYLLETTISGAARYADADFYEWPSGGASNSTSWTVAPTVSSIAFPSENVGQQWMVKANVSDLNVYSNNTAVTNAKGVTGRLEIWPWNYETAISSPNLSSPGLGDKYDSDDTPAQVSGSWAGDYGSFQVHDLTNAKPVFVWNRFANAASAEIAYGTYGGAHPDWTFCRDASACTPPSAFRVMVYINMPVTPLPDATPPTVSRIDSRILAKNGDTITVRSNELGDVYLVNQSVSVANLASITAAANANKNSIAISTINTNTVLTLSGLNDGLYNLYAADSSGNLSTAILATIRVDNTAPTASSIAVNSSGTAVIITGSETLTNSMQLYGIYQVTDSGSALSVNNVSFSGNIATLALSRSIPVGATVYFTYTPGSGDARGRIVDQAGNEMAALTKRSITNNSTSAISVSLTVPDSLSKGVSATMSVAVSVEGRVTFTIAGKRVPGCFNRAATGNTPITVTCTFKPAFNSRQTISATLTPTLSAYATTTSSVERVVSRRSNRR